MNPRIVISHRPVTFEADHYLGHACSTRHAHTYTVEAAVERRRGLPPLTDDGWVYDYRDLQRIVQEAADAVAVTGLLNDALENPTGERLAVWFADRVTQQIPEDVVLTSVTVTSDGHRVVLVQWAESLHA